MSFNDLTDVPAALLQCDRAKNGAEMRVFQPGERVLVLLQCDRATNGAEITPTNSAERYFY